MTKLVYGVGINDADYVVNSRLTGPRCRIYATWSNMLGRCYCEAMLKNNPTYIGCTVSPEWHRFSNFREWYLQQGDVTGKCLDKDILYPGNKVYAPDKCVFVPNELNVLLTKSQSTRGKYPIGVILKNDHPRNKKYNSKLNRKNLGYYYTPEEAHQVYINAKIQYIQDYYLSKETDQRIIDGLNRWIEVMRNGMYDLV